MSNFDGGIGTVKDRFEAFVTDDHFLSGKEGEDGRLTNTGISNDNDGFIASTIFGYTADALPDHFFDFKEVEGTFHSNDYDYTTQTTFTDIAFNSS